MIRRSLVPLVRPDTLVNQTRQTPARKSPARTIYLTLVLALAFYLSVLLLGPYITLQSGGIVTTERFTAASPYTSRIVKVHVMPGDQVKPGDKLVTVEAPDALDTAARLSSQKNTLRARELQVAARLSTVEGVLPIAKERKARAESTSAEITALKVKGFVPLSTQTDVGRELFEASREETSLVAERKALTDEIAGLRAAMSEVDAAFDQLRKSYSDGVIHSPVAGLVGARVPNQGAVARAGEPMLEVLYGRPFIFAYLPVGRLYRVKQDMPVVITDGSAMARGRIERIEGLAEALPPEFQNAFRPTDRQQIMRITYDDKVASFPVLSKVDISSLHGLGYIQAALKQRFASLDLLPADHEWYDAAGIIGKAIGL
ncbi:MAG: hypothetical protein R3D62_11105 [Xanthobacteraceae bacterium]